MTEATPILTPAVARDTAVEAIVTRAALAPSLPTGEHNGLYASIMADLEEQLDSDPDGATP
ncbi:hypothetical protein [Arthrobacter cryoconiti]|uniref:Uncharacterized protein n=1 Tax=Arthrobacter cryoconiti TaxID=748907 RepID=A0ABV8R0G6_9MICC|nr:hypothetical protein [Arthrobacter cryoconiti]MCC9069936.1 hypothetical protein [Arthrobacter cryoconiti]